MATFRYILCTNSVVLNVIQSLIFFLYLISIAVFNSGRMPVKGFVVAYRREFGDWNEVFIDRRINSYTLENLYCGTSYQIALTAFNNIGTGTSSRTEIVRTKGNNPISPESVHFIRSNITAVSLELSSWLDGGCPIQYFTVEFRRNDGYRNNDWIVVSSNVMPNSRFIIPDLEPTTAYNVRVTAHNNAGSTIAEYAFDTLNIRGMSNNILNNNNNHEYSIPSGEGNDVYPDNPGTNSFHASFDIQSHLVIIVIASIGAGILMAVLIAYFCLRSSESWVVFHFLLILKRYFSFGRRGKW